MKRFDAVYAACGNAMQDGYADVVLPVSTVGELLTEIETLQAALAVIAQPDDEAMRLATTLHYDMRGRAREALEVSE